MDAIWHSPECVCVRTSCSLLRTISLRVRVPVLSEQRISMPAMSSTELWLHTQQRHDRRCQERPIDRLSLDRSGAGRAGGEVAVVVVMVPVLVVRWWW